MRRMIRRALRDTLWFLGWPQIVAPTLAPFVGFGIHYATGGGRAASDEAQSYLLYGFLALCVFSVIAFLINLMLAPYRVQVERANHFERLFKCMKAKLEAIKAQELEALKPPPDIDEGDAKNAAKMKIGVAARDCLWPAMKALVPYYANAREAVANRISVADVRSAFAKTCDGIHGGANETPITSVHDLQNASKLRKMTLHEAQSDYYYNYCRHMRAVKLTYDLIKSAAPMHPNLVKKFRGWHEEWNKVQQAAIQEHIRLGREDLELNTIGTMHTHVLADMKPPDWDTLEQKASE